MKLRKVIKLLGIGIIVYLSLQVATIQIVILLTAPSSNLNIQENAISSYDARFSQVKDDLRTTSNAIGYLGCQVQDEDTMTYYYFLAQYAITPIILHDSIDKPLVLGNFPAEICTINSISLEQKHLSIVAEYDDGIFLLAPLK
jgi:hypothetical protein